MAPSHEFLNANTGLLKVLARHLARRRRQDHDDVFQELCVICLVDFAAFDPHRGPLWQWLTWRWSNQQRGKRRMQSLPDDMMNTIVVEKSCPLSNCEARDYVDHVWNHVGQLSKPLQSVITALYGSQPQSPKEIAQRLEQTPQNIYRIRNRAVQILHMSMVRSENVHI